MDKNGEKRVFLTEELRVATCRISRRLSYSIGHLWEIYIFQELQKLISCLHFISGIDVHFKKVFCHHISSLYNEESMHRSHKNWLCNFLSLEIILFLFCLVKEPISSIFFNTQYIHFMSKIMNLVSTFQLLLCHFYNIDEY